MNSCLVSRLSRIVDLADSEIELIAEIEEEETHHRKGEIVVDIGDPADRIFVIKYGWCVVRSPEVRGRSQILRVHLPGEIIGLAELGHRRARYRTQLHTDGALCPFSRGAVAEMCRRAPRLAALITALSAVDQMALRDRIVSLSRRSAEDQLIEFLLSIRDRMTSADVKIGNRFELPFTQAEIGDILGLTSVYVNKLFRKLRDSRRIEVERRTIRLIDREALERQVEFRSLYDDFDTSWFPDAR